MESNSRKLCFGGTLAILEAQHSATVDGGNVALFFTSIL
jgi:hypothetical protein